MSPLTMVGNEFKPQSPLPLKVKQVSIGQEIAFISHQERRLAKRRAKASSRRNSLRLGLHHETVQEFEARDAGADMLSFSAQATLEAHREELRVEARATNLARGFLKGFPYSRIENACYIGNDPPFERAGEIAMKFATGDTRVLKQTFEAWVQEGTLYYGANAINIDQKARYLQRLDARGRQLSLTDEQRRAKDIANWADRFGFDPHEARELLNGERRMKGRGPLADIPPLSSLKPTEGDRL